jgi:hypothetical protein
MYNVALSYKDAADNAQIVEIAEKEIVPEGCYKSVEIAPGINVHLKEKLINMATGIDDAKQRAIDTITQKQDEEKSRLVTTLPAMLADTAARLESDPDFANEVCDVEKMLSIINDLPETCLTILTMQTLHLSM